jgi:hypothetical protein
MDAEDWRKLVENKLGIAQCSDYEKALFGGRLTACHTLKLVKLGNNENFLFLCCIHAAMHYFCSVGALVFKSI